MADPDTSKLLNVQMAATFLGVSPVTIRRWAKSKLITGIKVGTRGDWRFTAEALLSAVNSDADASSIPLHTVQFYYSDDVLVGAVSRYLQAGDAAVVVATPEHAAALRQSLIGSAKDAARATTEDRLIVLDADETLAKFMVSGRPDPDKFEAVIGGVLDRAGRGRQVHIFGEMVARLWNNGNSPAAIQLEDLWNRLQRKREFSLHCAYSIHSFHDEEHAEDFAKVCDHHSGLVLTGEVGEDADPDERLRAIAALQQRAVALKGEVAKRKKAELLLAERNAEIEELKNELLRQADNYTRSDAL